MRRTKFFVPVLAAAVVAAGCSSSTAPSDSRTVLVIEPTEVTLTSGGTLRLIASSRRGEDRLDSPAGIVWSSTDDGVATVTADGTVTAKGSGAAQISAWWEGHRAFATVRVIIRMAHPRCGTAEWAALETAISNWVCATAF